MTTSELISLGAFVLALIVFIWNTRKNRVRLEVLITNLSNKITSVQNDSDLKIKALSEKVDAGFINREKIATLNQAINVSESITLQAQIVKNAEIAGVNSKDNREDHILIMVKVDELMKFIVNQKDKK